MERRSFTVVSRATILLVALTTLRAAAAGSEAVKTSGLEAEGQGVHLLRHLLSDDDGPDRIYYGGEYVLIHNVTSGYVHHYNDTYDCYTYYKGGDDHVFYDDDDGDGIKDDDDNGIDDDGDDDVSYGKSAGHAVAIGDDADDDGGYGGGHHDSDDNRKLLKEEKTYIRIFKCPDDYVVSKDKGVVVVFYKSAKGTVYYEKDDDDDDDHDDDDDGHTGGVKPKKVHTNGDDDDGGYGGHDDDGRRRMLGSRAMLVRKQVGNFDKL